jgi:diguanylate cyclase
LSRAQGARMTQSASEITSHSPVTSTPKPSTKRIRWRRQMYLAQGASYLFDAAVLFLYFLAGTTPAFTAVLYLVVGAGWTGLTLALSELNFNESFEDHYLSVPQGIVSVTIQLGAIYLAPEVGFYFVCIIFIVLGFGALRMSARQMGVVWSYAAAGLTVLFTWTDKAIAMPMNTPAESRLALLCFVTALGRFACTGLYGASLREALYRRSNELKAAHARIEELAQVDELTGVLNRRYIMQALNDELARAQRTGAPCSVAIVDIDHFKRINDTFGHPAGDEVLRRIAATLGASVRGIDKLGRYGGEEFLLVLPASTREQAGAAIDRLRQIIASIVWDGIAGDLRVTMSAGVAQVRENDAAGDILSRADVALYNAKDFGRDRVRLN